MDVTYTHCAGLDVYKKTVVACAITAGLQDAKCVEIRTFGTMMADLLALSDWLQARQVTHVALESTGEFWKPIRSTCSKTSRIVTIILRLAGSGVTECFNDFETTPAGI